MVATLIDKGYAYASNNGDVYFRTNKDVAAMESSPISRWKI